MALYKVILAYDGTEFFGSQKQKQKRTVQGVIEEGLVKLGGDGSSLVFAGRTDAGVHASGQVIAFDLRWGHDEYALARAMNALLPQDVAIRKVVLAPVDFHPRFDAKARKYRYRLFVDSTRNPLLERYAWRVPQQLEIGLLHQAAKLLPGEKDFRAFGRPVTPNGTTIRQVFTSRWEKSNNHFVFEIVANAFLYHMVRRLVYAQVLVGRGVMSVEAFREHLENGYPSSVQGLAPPQGLTLVEVNYLSVEK